MPQPMVTVSTWRHTAICLALTVLVLLVLLALLVLRMVVDVIVRNPVPGKRLAAW